MKLSPTLRVAFALTLAVILGATIVSYRNTRRLFAESLWVAHTQEVRATLSGLLSAIQDAETGQRGYVITGDESFLEPYVAAQREVPTRLQHLLYEVRDN